MISDQLETDPSDLAVHRIADAFELMGSTFLLDMHDVGSTLFFWRKALQIRHNGRYIKTTFTQYD